MNEMRKSKESRLTQLENNQLTFGMHIKSLENIQTTMGTCMKNLEHNQANIGACMKNMETNQVGLGASLKNLENQMGQLAQSLRENPPKFFSSDTEKNPKQCMAVTLINGKELDEPKNNEKTEKQVKHKNLESEENIETEIEKGGDEVNSKGGKQKSNQFIPRRITFP